MNVDGAVAVNTIDEVALTECVSHDLVNVIVVLAVAVNVLGVEVWETVRVWSECVKLSLSVAENDNSPLADPVSDLVIGIENDWLNPSDNVDVILLEFVAAEIVCDMEAEGLLLRDTVADGEGV